MKLAPIDSAMVVVGATPSQEAILDSTQLKDRMLSITGGLLVLALVWLLVL